MSEDHVPITVERPRWARATFDLGEVAQILGTSRSSVYRWAESGDLPVVRIGRRVLVSRAALEQLLGVEVEVALRDQ